MNHEKIESRSKETQKIGIIGMIGNVFLFLIKIVVAVTSGSQAMLADSINSATDILSSMMTFIGGKIAGEPSDERHNYGHGKAEYVFSLIISIVMGYLAIKIALEGIFSLIQHHQIEFSWMLIIVCLVTIVTKFGLYYYTSYIGKKEKNILILANSKDHINDVYTTLSVLAGVLATKLNIFFLDGVVAILISIRIFYTAVEFFLESYNVLLDSSMPEKQLSEIKNIVHTYPQIKRIDKITSKATGNAYVIILKVAVDGNMTVRESHDIVGKIKADILQKEHVYDVVVHVNPD